MTVRRKIRIISPAIPVYLAFGCAVCFAVPGGAESAFSSSPADAEAGKQSLVPARPEVKYKAEGLKDPFKGVEQKAVTPQGAFDQTQQAKPLPPMTVNGLIWGGAFPQAIVNNRVVKIGDMLDSEVKVVDITREGVVVFFDYKNYSLPPPAVVTNSQGSGSTK